MASNASGGAGTSGLNLERELVCFICTEILYQPLTLIDCLHTFCGSCLKQWFSHQRHKAIHARAHPSTNPYTCPTCRATVRDVRSNAMVNTWLHALLSQDPSRDRSQEEKNELSASYTPGENILPTLESRRRRGERRPRDHDEEARNRQMVEDARDRSLQDLQIPPTQSQTSLQPPPESRSHNTSRSRERAREERRERRREQARLEAQRPEDHPVSSQNDITDPSVPDEAVVNMNPTSPGHPAAVEARQRHQTVAHQASLVSLISSTESGTGPFSNSSLTEEQIRAQIMQHSSVRGLLAGIDFDNLTEAEEDALADRIAEAFRQGERDRQSTRQPAAHAPTPQGTGEATRDLDVHSKSRSRSRQRRAETLQNISQDDPVEVRPRSSRIQPVEGSESLLSPQAIVTHRRRSSNQSQSSTLTGGAAHPSSSTRSTNNLVAEESSSASTTNPTPVAELDATEQRSQRPKLSQQAQSSTPNQIAPLDEPSIICYQCHRADIQYEVYKHCPLCDVDLCMLCFRTGRGCKGWYGFGHTAMVNFEAKNADRRDTEHVELPHVLVSRSMKRPEPSAIAKKKLTKDGKGVIPVTTRSDPRTRSLEGSFCDRCGAFANSQFWSCDDCNHGEWGFCKDCVNTHHCCTHPLLPLAHESTIANIQKYQRPNIEPPLVNKSSGNNALGSNTAKSRPSSATSATSASSALLPGYYPITIRVSCDLCQKSIPHTEPRYHCPSHSAPSATDSKELGDYDLCTPCYHDLVKTNRIKREDGPAGWRKCPNNHRMIVIVFEPDAEGGHRRVVLSDLVGGWKMTEQDMTAWATTVTHRRDQTNEPAQHFSFDATLPTRGTWSWREDQNTARRGTRPRTLTESPPSSPFASPTSPTVPTARSKFPPDGGFGGHALAAWSYYPDPGEDGRGELMFPSNAVVREIKDINGDWCEGVYAGDIGIVWSAYLRSL